MHACWFQHFEIVELLLNDKRININLGNKLGQTAFHFSFQNGETKILELMMKNKNLDIQKADNNGCTPLMRACSYGHLEVVKILMNSEKRPDLNLENSHGQSAFYLACRNGNTELVKLLLENEDLNINTIDNFGRSPLMMACSSGKLKNVELILGFKSEIDINLMDKDRKTALDFATIVWVKSSRESQEQFVNKQMEYSKIIELLESFGNSPNATRDYLRKRTVRKFSFIFYFCFVSFFISILSQQHKKIFIDLEASNLCSLIVLLSDGYYNLKE